MGAIPEKRKRQGTGTHIQERINPFPDATMMKKRMVGAAVIFGIQVSKDPQSTIHANICVQDLQRR